MLWADSEQGAGGRHGYDATLEVVLANIAKTAPREFFTTQGLVAIGDVSLFKVYVKTTTGNERGSNTVKITRTT